MSTVVEERASEKRSLRQRLSGTEQGTLVLTLTVLLVGVGAVTTPDFLTTGNLSIIPRMVAAIGIIAVGEAFVILGKGVDLSVGAMALVAGQLVLALTDGGMREVTAITLILLLALAVGLVNGIVVAFFDVPPLFVTLATGPLLLGGVNVLILNKNLYTLNTESLIAKLDQGMAFGLIPTAVVISAIVFLAGWFVWSYTSYGRMLRAVGDNPETARQTGMPVRLIQVTTYIVSAMLATLAGWVALAREGTAVTTGTPFSGLLFTALTVVVIGGVSLSGGRGTILGVLAGALFVGVLDNILTLQQLSSAVQAFIRGLVLVSAIALDAWLNPRDEETARSDDL
jgi:ribose transport system permease protein